MCAGKMVCEREQSKNCNLEDREGNLILDDGHILGHSHILGRGKGGCRGGHRNRDSNRNRNRNRNSNRNHNHENNRNRNRSNKSPSFALCVV